MWKYIVYWVLKITIIGSPTPEIDEFGRETGRLENVSTVRYEREPHSKEFTDRSKAFKFYEKAKAQDNNDWFLKPDIVDVRIDSIYIVTN